VSAVEVLYYREGQHVPVAEWLAGLEPGAAQVCLARLGSLRREGYELRRPAADYLRDGVYELRARWRGINYRMLYFFHGRGAVVVSHGFTKQRARVPELEIQMALARKTRFTMNPEAHTYRPGD